MIMNIVVAAKPLYKVDEWLMERLDGKAEEMVTAGIPRTNKRKDAYGGTTENRVLCSGNKWRYLGIYDQG